MRLKRSSFLKKYGKIFLKSKLNSALLKKILGKNIQNPSKKYVYIDIL